MVINVSNHRSFEDDNFDGHSDGYQSDDSSDGDIDDGSDEDHIMEELTDDENWDEVGVEYHEEGVIEDMDDVEVNYDVEIQNILMEVNDIYLI